MSSHKNFLETPKKNQRNTTSTIVFVNMWYWERNNKKKKETPNRENSHPTRYILLC